MENEVFKPLLEQNEHLSPSNKKSSLKLFSTAATEIIRDKVNVHNAKIVAVLLIVGFTLYHGIVHLTFETDSCKSLLSNGRFRDENFWQPYGCMTHKYSLSDAQMCAKYLDLLHQKNKIVFVGDSRMRYLYLSFLRHFGLDVPEITGEARHKDQRRQSTKLNLDVEFKWRPVLNDSWLTLIDEFSKDQPSVVIAGAASWMIVGSNESSTGQGLADFQAAFSAWAEKADSLFAQAKPRTNKLIWVLQDPVLEKNLIPEWKSIITNKIIDQYNTVALEILKGSPNIWVWSSAPLVTQEMMIHRSVHMDNGLDLTDALRNIQTQMLLNLYCNDKMKYEDGTCCRAADPVTALQKVTMGFFAYCLVSWIVLSLWMNWKVSGNQQQKSTAIDSFDEMLPGALPTACSAVPAENKLASFLKIHAALLRFGLIMTYVFLCDRTTLFMRSNKHFTNLSFWLPFGFFFALGIFFNDNSKFTQVLHRDQTDEWKGWMQLIILIYHMTGASKILPIYMHVRILVSGYIFLSGFGHFSFFWKKGDFGLIRFFQVLFRMNFLTVALCLIMNQSYQFYYFVPLITYWYIVFYIVLALPPRVTAMSSEANSLHYLYVVLKLVAMLAFSSIMHISEVFFEHVFVIGPWKVLFVTKDEDSHEWWFRWGLDRYSMAFGCIFALAYQLAQKYCLIDDTNRSNLWPTGWTSFASLVSIAGIGSYTTFTFFCPSKPDCNEVHSYIVIVPLLGYIILRNVFGVLRTKYSTLFAWFGKISLELFVGQFHMWLAADTYGVLVLVPNYPVVNVLVTSFIFLCLAHELHRITEFLTPIFVPSDGKAVFRNMVILLLIVIPFGIKDISLF